MSKFRKWGDRLKTAQTFDRETITVTKGGKTYNQYDAIQAANIDTDIYKVMDKYNINGNKAQILMEGRSKARGIFEDITKIQALGTHPADIINVAKSAQEQFEALPTDIKQQYGNNLEDFLKAMQKQAKQQQEQTVTQQEQEGTKDETK